MKRKHSSLPMRSPIFFEALEPRIAPAGLLNESKFTSVVVGGTVLLDASGGPNDFQGLSTGFGTNSGTYLLYLVTGKALIYTSDLNGDGILEPGEITGISLGVDSLGRAPSLILFSDVHGDIVTNLEPGHGVSALSDSDNNASNGRDGRILLDTSIANITLRTVTAADLDSSIAGDTVANRLGLTSFSIYGNIYCGGDFGGLTIDTSGSSLLAAKFNGTTGVQLYLGSTPQIGTIDTGTAANGQLFHFTEQSSNNVEGILLAAPPPAGQHGGDISDIAAASTSTVFSIGGLDTGEGGPGARGGNISDVTLHGDTGSYELIAGDGGSGATGAQGGSIVNFNDLGTVTGQVILHTGAGGTGTINGGGAGGTATFATTSIAATVDVLLGNGGNGFTTGGAGSGLSAGVFSSPEGGLAIGSKFVGTWHDLGDVGNTHPNDTSGSSYSPEVINFNDPSFFSNPAAAVASGVADTYGDGVFSTSTPGQVVVVFGDGEGGLNDNSGSFNVQGSESVILHVPGIVNPVFTVGDFNGDGRPDIAVASADPNNFAGVYVFLDQIGTAADPINSHNFSKNPLGDHPFSNAIQSAIPSFTNFLPVFTGPGAVLALAAGDFNGDGITDIAFVQEVTTIVAGIGPKEEVVGVLFGEAAHDANGNALTNTVNGQVRNAATGLFYGNPADVGAAPTLQIELFTNDSQTPLLRVTSLTSNNAPGTGTTVGSLATPEIIGYGVPGTNQFFELSVDAVSSTTHQPISAFLDAEAIPLGKVDTDRALGPTHISLTGASLQDFSFVDLNNDGLADAVALTKTPLEFLVTFSGDGAGDFTIASHLADNAGIILSVDGSSPQATALAITDANQTGQFDTFAFLAFPAANFTPVVQEDSLGAADPFYSGGSGTLLRSFVTGTAFADQTITGLDAFYVDAPTAGDLHPVPGYGLISPDSSDPAYADLFLFNDYQIGADIFPSGSRPLTENGYLISAGNGGEGTTGTGGDGGAIGAPTLTSASGVGDVSGPLQITFPADVGFQGAAVLVGGSGGEGFLGGGNGGGVEGVVVSYAAGTTVLHSRVALLAGNAGNSIAGPRRQRRQHRSRIRADRRPLFHRQRWERGHGRRRRQPRRKWDHLRYERRVH